MPRPPCSITAHYANRRLYCGAFSNEVAECRWRMLSVDGLRTSNLQEEVASADGRRNHYCLAPAPVDEAVQIRGSAP
jgi:hypothetical protein